MQNLDESSNGKGLLQLNGAKKNDKVTLFYFNFYKKSSIFPEVKDGNERLNQAS